MQAQKEEWRHAIKVKKEAKLQAELAQQRAQQALAEARWQGVPAWKRAIIEKKESAVAQPGGMLPPPPQA